MELFVSISNLKRTSPSLMEDYGHMHGWVLFKTVHKEMPVLYRAQIVTACPREIMKMTGLVFCMFKGISWIYVTP